MAQIVFLLFEDKQEPKDSEGHYKVEVHFTPGGKGREEIIAVDKAAHLSTENIKADISKMLSYTSLKRMVPGDDSQIRHSQEVHSISSQLTKNTCTLSSSEIRHIKNVKSNSSPDILCKHVVSQPIDVMQQPMPEIQLYDDSPVEEELLPHNKSKSSISL